jgi:hypothetical protein
MEVAEFINLRYLYVCYFLCMEYFVNRGNLAVPGFISAPDPNSVLDIRKCIIAFVMISHDKMAYPEL